MSRFDGVAAAIPAERSLRVSVMLLVGRVGGRWSHTSHVTIQKQ
jgi:hypothetical protein